MGKMKTVSERAGLVTTSGANENNTRLFTLYFFPCPLLLFRFLCEFDTETSHLFCASAWPAVPLDSITMRQSVGTRCSSKTRDETGWVYEALRVFSDRLIDSLICCR